MTPAEFAGALDYEAHIIEQHFDKKGIELATIFTGPRGASGPWSSWPERRKATFPTPDACLTHPIPTARWRASDGWHTSRTRGPRTGS